MRIISHTEKMLLKQMLIQCVMNEREKSISFSSRVAAAADVFMPNFVCVCVHVCVENVEYHMW